MTYMNPPTKEKLNRNWEAVTIDEFTIVDRLAVPGGWFVRTIHIDHQSMVLNPEEGIPIVLQPKIQMVFDKDHRWELDGEIPVPEIPDEDPTDAE